MLDIGFDKFTNSEREEFTRLINFLLSKTFIVRDIYDIKEERLKVNPEYRFVERNFEYFCRYLAVVGFDLQKDNNYGVISLYNRYDYNRIKLDRNTTLIIYVLRLIFEEEREKVTLRNEVLTTVGQVIHKLITLGAIKKKMSDKDISDSFRLLSNHNIIQKLDRTWEDPEAKILILPSILFVVTNEKISKLYDILNIDDDEIEEENSDILIRGEDEI
ncbi:DUF4194 domain-containing protein [Caldicellulosiruptoraceae bacterium PP1]